MKKLSIFILLFFVLSGCASKTTVILLPDEDGTTGSVVVKAEETSVIMTEPYTSSSVRGAGPSEAVTIDKDQVEKKFTDLFEAQPAKPESFILYFTHSGSELTEDSLKRIPRVIEAVKKRTPASVSIIGHTDRSGKDSFNINLSLARAEAVKKILLNSGLKIDNLFITSHGENNPLIPTADGVPEPKNRRVEILIR